jgi:hypothetical protein
METKSQERLLARKVAVETLPEAMPSDPSVLATIGGGTTIIRTGSLGIDHADNGDAIP